MPLVLEFLSGSIQGEKRFDGKLVRIGRDPQGEVAFDFQKDPAVSFNHAVIESANGRYELRDLGSTNGTLVNGKKISRHFLEEGDLVAFGLAGPQVKVCLGEGLSVSAERAGATKILVLDRPKLRLEVVRGQGEGKKFAFELSPGRVVRLGRERNNDVAFFEPPSPVVSRYHAELTKSGEGLFLEDVGSTNGTFLNGKKVSGRTAVKNGDRIALGNNGPELAVGLEMPVPPAPGKPPVKKKPVLVLSIAGGALAVLVILLIALFSSGETEKADGASSASVEENGSLKDEDFAFVQRRVKELSHALGEDSSKVKPSFISVVIEQIHHTEKMGDIPILLGKGPLYLPEAQRALKKKKLPPELAYLAFIESKFNPVAKSPSGAVGLWQFMIPTARDFGLKVDLQRKIDERTDPVKATMAAAEYLNFLIRDRGSAFKAIASYNTGQGSVSRASRKVEDYLSHGDYFYLSQKGFIPQETRDYVPRFLAAAILYTDPERFGFSQ
ncbi:MAG: FHA domain-containing protein [candidate division Zixibacteria bacterium]|nr:FHA domain-containing protein [candidate division Zixibacteria bacterium]